MSHVLSANEFFNQYEDSRLIRVRESILSIPTEALDKIFDFVFPTNESLSIDGSDQISHQVYLLKEFENLEEINFNENFLIKQGYDPATLSENGTYQNAIELAKSVNENLFSWLKTALGQMTENWSLLGSFQFLLDIIGLIPGSWFGFPVDVIANGLNAVIYLFRKNYLMMLINLVAMVDISKIIGNPLKIVAKTFSKPLSTLVSKLFIKGSGKAAAEEAKLAIKNPGAIATIGKALSMLANWIAKGATTLFKSIVPSIVKAVDKLTFGAFNLSKYVPKLTVAMDQWLVKLETFGQEASTASAELLSKKTVAAADKSITKGATKVGDKAAETAKILHGATPGVQNTVKGFTSRTLLNRIGKVQGFTDDIVKQVMSSPKYTKLSALGASDAVKLNYVYLESTKLLSEKILSKEVGVMGILKNKKIIAKLGEGAKAWKGADKMIANAVKRGDSTALKEMMTKMLDDPDFFALISKNSPELTKTISLFKEVPEALINGQKTMTKLIETGSKFAEKTVYRKHVLAALAAFMTKQFLKGECGKFISSGNLADAIDRSKKTVDKNYINPTVTNMEPVMETMLALSKIHEQNVTDINNTANQTLGAVRSQNPEGIDITGETRAEVDKFKRENPEGAAIINQIERDTDKSIEDLKEATDQKNPCYGETEMAKAKAGANIWANKAWHEGTVVTDVTNPEQMKDTGLTEYTQTILKALHQDTNILPQESIQQQNPEIKAYFSDVFDYQTGKVDINEESTSRLEKSLDQMTESGLIKDQAERERIKKNVLDHWTNGTVPPQLTEPTLSKEQANESLFKIGKLVTIR